MTIYHCQSTPENLNNFNTPPAELQQESTKFHLFSLFISGGLSQIEDRLKTDHFLPGKMLN